MKTGQLSAARAAGQSDASRRGTESAPRPEPALDQDSAGFDSESAIRWLGEGVDDGTKFPSHGTGVRIGTSTKVTVPGSLPSETRVGSRMEPLDDDWDIDEPAATHVVTVDGAPTQAASKDEATQIQAPRDAVAERKETSSVRPASPSQAPSAGRFSSPLGLSPPVTKPATVPPPAATTTSNPEVPTAPAAPEHGAPQSAVEKPAVEAKPKSPTISRVQLAAEAFRQKAGTKATPSQIPVASPSAGARPLASAPSAKAPSTVASPVEEVMVPQPVVDVAPVVELEDTLELQEIPAAQDTAPPAIASAQIVGSPEPTPPTAVQAAPSVAADPVIAFPTVSVSKPAGDPAVVPSPVESLSSLAEGQSVPPSTAESAPVPTKPNAAVAAAPSADENPPSGKQTTPVMGKGTEPHPAAEQRRDSTSSKLPLASQDAALSLDASYAVEFFSSPPPPVHSEVQGEHELVHESRHVRTPEQVARQQYLRRLVLKVMLVAVVFLAVVVYLLWQRGLLHLAR